MQIFFFLLKIVPSPFFLRLSHGAIKCGTCRAIKVAASVVVSSGEDVSDVCDDSRKLCSCD